MIIEVVDPSGKSQTANIPGGKTLGEIFAKHHEEVHAVKINGKFRRDWQSHVCGHGIDNRATMIFKTRDYGFWIGLVISIVTTTLSMVLAPKPRKPNFNDRQESTATTGLHNATETGSPLFYSFGENRLYGTVIGSGISVAQDGRSMRGRIQYFMGLTDGNGINSIDEIIINDQPIENHPDIVTDFRYGYAVQDVMTGFNNITQAFSDGRTFTPTQSITYTSRSTNLNQFKPVIGFNSFVSYTAKGSQRGQTCFVRVERKLTADPVGNFAEVAGSPFRFDGMSSAPIYFPIEVTVAGVGAGAQYDLRFTKTTTGTGPNDPVDPQLFNVEEIEWTTRTYPNCALMTLSNIPSADFPSLEGLRVSARVRGNLIPIPDGFGGWVTTWTRERVWIARYLATNPTFGCGSGARRMLPPRVMTKAEFPGLIDNPFRLIA